MTAQFAPKDAETLKTEITTELGIAYEGNEDLVDKMVNRELKDEDFKASLHADKVKHLARKDFYKQQLEKAGIDPKTGEKKPNGSEKPTPKNKYSLEEIDDITALTSIPREDRQEILDYADRKGIKPAEALNSSFIKVYLKSQAEERATAAAANVGVSKRGVQTGNILEQARRGEEVDFDALAQARIDAKKKERGLK